MSAPDTRLEKQKRHHMPVLIGIVAAVAIATFSFLLMLTSDADPEDTGVADEAAEEQQESEVDE